MGDLASLATLLNFVLLDLLNGCLGEELLGTHCFDVCVHHGWSFLELHLLLLLSVLELVGDLRLNDLASCRLQAGWSFPSCSCSRLGLCLLSLKSLVLLEHVSDRLLLAPDLLLGLFELLPHLLGMLLEL